MGIGRTGKHPGVVCEAVTVVLPFRVIHVQRPSSDQFADAVAVEDLVRGAVQVQPSVRLCLFGGAVVGHVDLLFSRCSALK